ncbi:hypothetical protein [Methylobacterium goesingense]|uniref:hypothetical protein n=1 Tax=Methylobacterium goesingense TaxID=243690 RepID=UPI001EE32474|nr:hypothetical protein [Methylobacterium goesingense]
MLDYADQIDPAAQRYIQYFRVLDGNSPKAQRINSVAPQYNFLRIPGDLIRRADQREAGRLRTGAERDDWKQENAREANASRMAESLTGKGLACTKRLGAPTGNRTPV